MVAGGMAAIERAMTIFIVLASIRNVSPKVGGSAN